MKHWTLKTAAAAAALALLLAGCGSKNADPAAANASQSAGGQAADQTAAGGENQPPNRTADMMAKVVKVNADSIVVQESKTPPSEMPGGGGYGGGRRGNRGGQTGGGQANGGQATGEQAAGGQGTGSAGAVSGGGGSSNGSGSGAGNVKMGSRTGRPGGFGQMAFKDEQTTVAISADTEIIAMSFGKDGRTTTQLKPSDLKEGDIVTIWLDSDKKTAQYMMQRSIPANFRKAGNQQ